MIQRYQIPNEGYMVLCADGNFILYTDHLADQVAVAKAWGRKLAELESDRDTAMSQLEDAEGRVKRLTAALNAKIAELKMANAKHEAFREQSRMTDKHRFTMIYNTSLAQKEGKEEDRNVG